MGFDKVKAVDSILEGNNVRDVLEGDPSISDGDFEKLKEKLDDSIAGLIQYSARVNQAIQKLSVALDANGANINEYIQDGWPFGRDRDYNQFHKDLGIWVNSVSDSLKEMHLPGSFD